MVLLTITVDPNKSGLRRFVGKKEPANITYLVQTAWQRDCQMMVSFKQLIRWKWSFKFSNCRLRGHNFCSGLNEQKGMLINTFYCHALTQEILAFNGLHPFDYAFKFNHYLSRRIASLRVSTRSVKKTHDNQHMGIVKNGIASAYCCWKVFKL